MARPKGSTKRTPEHVAEALESAKGLVSYAAKRLGVSVSTVSSMIRDYPVCAEALTRAREQMNDLGELRLFEKVDAGESWAVCFYLKTQGKKRGYVERQEITGAEGGPVDVRVVRFTDA